MTKHYFEIRNKNNDIIKGDFRIPFLENKSSIVIFSHGFKGFRNWSFIPYVCQKLAENGFISVNFDFSLNGIIDDVNQFYDDAIFRRNKVSTEVEDLQILIDNIIDDNITNINLENIWSKEIYLVGHSLGGAVSILSSKKFNEIKKISLWASVSTLDRNTVRQKQVWKDKGYTDIVINPTGQLLHLNYSYIEDKENSFEENQILKTLNSLIIPVQIIHPANDITVKIKEAYELEQAAGNTIKRELFVIEKAGHTFNCRHPFDQPSIALDTAIETTISFLKNT